MKRKNFICPICQKTFRNSKSLKKHENTHIKAGVEIPDLPKYKELEVGFGHFKRKYGTALMRYSSFFEKEDFIFYCTKCDYSNKNSKAIQYHIEVHHYSPGYLCPRCDRYFKAESSLKEHLVKRKNPCHRLENQG